MTCSTNLPMWSGATCSHALAALPGTGDHGSRYDSIPFSFTLFCFSLSLPCAVIHCTVFLHYEKCDIFFLSSGIMSVEAKIAVHSAGFLSLLSHDSVQL